MRDRIILYGIGGSAELYLNRIKEEWDIVAVSDGLNKCNSWNGYCFIEPEKLTSIDWDYIVVSSRKNYDDISEYLIGIGIDKEKIIKGWFKEVAELAFWKEVLEEEKEFHVGDYRKLYLGLAEEENDDFLKGKIVADFGCGPRGSLIWTNTPLIKIGIDILIPEYMKLSDLSKHGIFYVTASEKKIPIPDSSIDYMFSLETLDRVEDIEATIKEIARVIKKGGIFAGCFPLNEPIYEDDGQPQSFDASIIELLQGEFDLISKRIAKRNYPDSYYDMLNGRYVDSLKDNEKGFLWFRAIRNNS